MSTTLTATTLSIPAVRHEDGNVREDKRGARNTMNNHKFGVLTEQVILVPAVPASSASETTAAVAEVPAVTETRESLVEIVRSGKTHTRIRRDLTCNGPTDLVDTDKITNI